MEHPYAQDINLLGHASLFQRLDVTHTVHGESTLLRWLTFPVSITDILPRQAAVEQLSEAVEYRQELEASVGNDARHPKSVRWPL